MTSAAAAKGAMPGGMTGTAPGRDGAAGEALDRAVLAMRDDRAADALLWVRLAAAFNGAMAEGGGEPAGESARRAALAFLRERLGLEDE